MEMRDITKDAVIISEDASFREAIELMVKKKTNTLLVVNEEGELSGEVNVSDLLDAIIPMDLNPDNIDAVLGTEDGFKKAVRGAEDRTVMDFMSADFEAVHMTDTLIEIAGTAIAHQTEHIPVVDRDNHPIGVISRQGLKHILAKYLGIKGE
ncbi:MAG TPA: CBS domain-containing protein [Candidatus Paceibacterota bacterium]|nr:CBS domain-containing protein [Candidatus Paceibacterota bacterium]